MRWLVQWWRTTQRRIDVEILWPTCKEQAFKRYGENDDAHNCAKAAFAVHAFHDPAWLVLGEAGIIEAIEALQ